MLAWEDTTWEKNIEDSRGASFCRCDKLRGGRSGRWDIQHFDLGAGNGQSASQEFVISIKQEHTSSKALFS